MKMNRNKVALFKNTVPQDGEYVDLPPTERICLVWELTKEVYALTGEYDVVEKLKRDVVNLIRK